MPSTGERIAYLREQKGYTQTDFSKVVNIGRSVLNRIEMGTRPIRDDELKSIANALEVSADYLIGNECNSINDFHLAPEEKQLIETYRKLDERGKQSVSRTADGELDMLEGK